MRTTPFGYDSPDSLSDALAALDRDGAVAVAGGQALVQTMKLGLASPSRLVDLNAVPGLDEIDHTADGLVIGAMVRVRELARSPLVRRHALALATAAELLGDVQVRNRATIGGNICFADPRANLSPALISLSAELRVSSSSGTRSMLVDDVFAGFRRNSLAPSQLVTSVRLPQPLGQMNGTYRELARQQNGVPIVNVAVTLIGDPVSRAGVGVGGLAMTPFRAHAVEAALTGMRLESLSARDLTETLTRGGAVPYEDLHGHAAYRLRVARVLLGRALDDIAMAHRG